MPLVQAGDGVCALQLPNKLIDPAHIDQLDRRCAEDWVDVVIDQPDVRVIGRHAPAFLAVQCDEIAQEFRDRLRTWRNERLVDELNFNLCFALTRVLIIAEGFPLLFGFSGFVYIVEDDGIGFVTFYNGGNTVLL